MQRVYPSSSRSVLSTRPDTMVSFACHTGPLAGCPNSAYLFPGQYDALIATMPVTASNAAAQPTMMIRDRSQRRGPGFAQDDGIARAVSAGAVFARLSAAGAAGGRTVVESRLVAEGACWARQTGTVVISRQITKSMERNLISPHHEPAPRAGEGPSGYSILSSVPASNRCAASGLNPSLTFAPWSSLMLPSVRTTALVPSASVA